MKNQAIAATAFAAVLSLAVSNAAQAGDHEKAEMEKCYGIVKAGKNDCHANGHSCAGSAKTDGDKAEWIKLPKGLCEKIVGGSLEAPADE